MTTTSEIMIPEASALTVDTSRIDVSEFSEQDDKDYLMQKGENILRIVAKAALDIGKELVEIQERFRADNPKGEGLGAFYSSLGINHAQVSRWTARYKAYLAYMEIFGEFDPDGADKFNQLADRAASGLMMLPTDYREAFFADIVNGDLPSQSTVEEVNSRTEVKLSKAEELLAAARVRKEQADDKWEMVKTDQNIDKASKEYKTAMKAPQYFSKTINAYENKIADLTAQVEAEQARVSEYERREEKTKSELEKLRFDDDSTREERIKRLTNSLTISVPQVMADLQKFFTEKDHYPTEVREHLLEQSVYLTNYIADQLDS